MYFMLRKNGTLLVEKLALQSHHGNENTSNTVVISAKGILQKQKYVNGFKHDITIAPCSIVPFILPGVTQLQRSSRNHPYIQGHKILLVA